MVTLKLVFIYFTLLGKNKLLEVGPTNIISTKTYFDL